VRDEELQGHLACHLAAEILLASPLPGEMYAGDFKIGW